MVHSPFPNEPMLTFSRPVLPRLSVTEAQAHSLIARHGAAMELALHWPDGGLLLSAIDDVDESTNDRSEPGGDPSIWQLGFAPHGSVVLHDVCSVRRDLEWAGARLRLHMPSSAVSTWVGASLSDVSLDELADPLLSVAVETLLAHVFHLLDVDKANGELRVSSAPTSTARLPHSWTLTARHKATGQVAYVFLEADTLGLMLLANLIARAPSIDNGLHVDALPISLCAELGHTILRADELKALHPRDTIFFDDYRVLPDGDLWLVAGNQGLRVRPQANSYCVTQGWTSLMNEISKFPSEQTDMDPAYDDDPPDASSVSEFDVDAVPVRLTFSLGQRQLTLGDLRALQPGEIFDLARPLASGPVIVRANGAFLGTGDLVDIDGRIGVTLRTVGEREA